MREMPAPFPRLRLSFRATSPSLAVLSLVLLSTAGCLPGEQLTAEQLLDPQACADCHTEHYRQWSGSMHAYASADPVFLAMNQRGQRETNGELGSFCVDCHAPMAVRTGATEDGLNLDEVDDALKGVTCAFCHRVESIEDDHNALMTLGLDSVLRGALPSPVRTAAHDSMYSPLHDRNSLDSSALCGSCHDVVTPAGVHLERTFAEWKETVFAHEGASQLTCGNCHMRGRDGPAYAAPNAPTRRVHDHSMEGVDIALTPFPEADQQREEIERLLDSSLLAELCVHEDPTSYRIDVTLENVAAGHSFPSGSTQDRRVWVELKLYGSDELLWSSGVVDEDQAVAELDDPNLWLIRSVMRNEAGEEVHSFWEAASTEGELLEAPSTNDITDPNFEHWLRRSYVATATGATRVSLRVRMRPMGREVLQSLVDSGDLDAEHLDAVPTYDLASTELEWTDVSGLTCVD